MRESFRAALEPSWLAARLWRDRRQVRSVRHDPIDGGLVESADPGPGLPVDRPTSQAPSRESLEPVAGRARGRAPGTCQARSRRCSGGDTLCRGAEGDRTSPFGNCWRPGQERSGHLRLPRRRKILTSLPQCVIILSNWGTAGRELRRHPGDKNRARAKRAH